jgi:hypothetical protein
MKPPSVGVGGENMSSWEGKAFGTLQILYDDVQGLGASDCKTEPSRCNIISGDSRTDQTAQRTLVAE